MKSKPEFVCPRCEYPLVSVFAVEGTKRQVIALTCPEPYCDHMQMIPKQRSSEIQGRAKRRDSLKRAAN